MLHVRRNHVLVGRSVGVLGEGAVFVFIVVVVAVLLAHEVLGALVFVCTAIILIAANCLVDVARGELVQLLVVAKNDDSHINRAEDRELVGLFEEAALALEEGNGAVAVVLDGLDLNLSATHGVRDARGSGAWSDGEVGAFACRG
jgi:hypothetical protein